MKKTISALMALIMIASLWTSASAAPASQTSELGQLKICKVAGTGVTLGTIFTFRVAGRTYNVPAGPSDNNGYCVLAGEYPLDTQVNVEEVIPSGYYVSRIEVKPDRAVSRSTSQGSLTVEIGSGVTEAIFTNKVIGTSTPTPVNTATPRPTRTPTPTPGCAPNCTPTPTPIPTGRMQIWKEAEGAGVTGYFTFRFGTRSRTVPVGACAGLISVNAGTVTITEDARTGFSIADIYTIPSNRLISKDLNGRSATVRIVEGNAAAQTIVIFRNRAVSVTPPPTFTPTATSTPTFTSTPTGTITPPTSTFTPTPTGSVTPTVTPPVCPPMTITANFANVQAGQSVEGLGVVAPYLNIDAKGTAVKVAEGVNPLVYGAPNVNFIINGGLAAGGGFSDVVTKNALQPHLYTFSFAQGVSVSNFSLHMLDYGDFNPSNSTSHLVTLTAYNLNNALVDQEILDFTSLANNSPEYGNLILTGDAVDAAPGQPGNWTWNVSGTGIVRIVLEFGVGHDPNIALDLLSFTTECP